MLYDNQTGMCNPKMCKMKTFVITMISVLLMIPLVSFADGEKTGNTHAPVKDNTVADKADEAALISNLVVINLNEESIDNGLPADILGQFSEVLTYPRDVEDANDVEVVVVGFSYDDDGYIHVENSKSSNDSFNKHVVSNIEKIRLRNGSVTIGKQYFAKFSFKKL